MEWSPKEQVHIGAIGIHHVDTCIAPAELGEDERLSIRGPVRVSFVDLRRIGQAGQPAAIYVDDIKIIGVVFVYCRKGDFLPVGRPGRVEIVLRAVRQADRVGAVGVHDVDFIVAIPLGRKSNPPAIPRPGRIPVIPHAVADIGDAAPIRVHDEDFEAASRYRVTSGNEGYPGSRWGCGKLRVLGCDGCAPRRLDSPSCSGLGGRGDCVTLSACEGGCGNLGRLIARVVFVSLASVGSVALGGCGDGLAGQRQQRQQGGYQDPRSTCVHGELLSERTRNNRCKLG